MFTIKDESKGKDMKVSIQQIRMSLKQPWVLSVLFAVCIPVFPEYVCPPLAAASLIAACADAKARRRPLSVGRLGKFILAYIAWMALGLIYSRLILTTLATVMMWVSMFAVYLAMTTVLTDSRRLDTMLCGISLVSGTVGVIGCFEYVARATFGWKVSLQFWYFLDKIVFKWLPLTLMPDSVNLRVCSTFNNPNIMAEYLIMVIPFVAYYAFSGKRTGGRLFCRVCLLAAVGAVAFSFSRGCYFALLVIALIFCFANIRRIMVFIASFATIMLVLPDSVIRRFFSVSGSDTSINERLRIWTAGIQEFLHNPVLGMGAGTNITWAYLIKNGINAPHMHNLFLQLLAEGGLVALVIMLAAGWKLFRTGYVLAYRTAESRMAGVALIAFTASFCTIGLIEFPFMTPKLVGVFLMVISLADCAARIYLKREMQPLREIFTLPYWKSLFQKAGNRLTGKAPDISGK